MGTPKSDFSRGQHLRDVAEQRGVPLRTLDDVKTALAQAKTTDADRSMARLMLRHGRLTDEAREYVAREYPQ